MDRSVGLIFAVAILIVSYRVSLARNPWRTCRRCNGSPGRSGWFYVWSRGACNHCGGSGKKDRWGTRMLARRRR